MTSSGAAANPAGMERPNVVSARSGWSLGYLLRIGPGRILAPALAIGISVGLFWLMQWLIAVNDSPPSEAKETVSMEFVELDVEEAKEPDQAESTDSAPAPKRPPTPALPPPPAPSFDLPTTAASPVQLPDLPKLDAPKPVKTVALPTTVPLQQVDLNSLVALPDAPAKVPIPAAKPAGTGPATATGSSAGSGKKRGPWKGEGKRKAPGQRGAGSKGAKPFSGRRQVPTDAARPQYPEYAFENNIDGRVLAELMIDPFGQVVSVKIIEAEPEGIFEEAALAALKLWQYPELATDNYRIARQELEFKRREYISEYNVFKQKKK